MCTDKKLLFGFIIHFPSEYGENWGEGKLQAVSVSAWGCYEKGKRWWENFFCIHQLSNRKLCREYNKKHCYQYE